MLREVITIVLFVILAALLFGAAMLTVTVPCDPAVQKCLGQPQEKQP